MSVSNFGEWIQEQLDRREWKQADLARNAHMGTGYVSKLVNGLRDPGPDACRALAKAFELPEDEVFRAAGLLTKPRRSPEQEEAHLNLHTLFDMLGDNAREEALEYLRMKVRLQQQEQSRVTSSKSGPGVR